MRQGLGIAGVVALLGGLGAYNAATGLGGSRVDYAPVQARLDAVPLSLGPFDGTERAIPATQLKIAEARAHLGRVYTERGTGEAVSVMVLAGEPGPLGAHTPEVCFAGAGYAQLGASEARPTACGELWRGRFECPPSAGNAPMEAFWGWSADGRTWSAASNPRLAFTDASAVLKLYLTRLTPAGLSPTSGADKAGGVCERLLALLAPHLSDALAGPAAR